MLLKQLTLLLACLLSLAAAAATTHSKRTVLPPYDYVIVGSGAGGGPLAARLALAGRSVLLIEAGDDQGSNIREQVPTYSFASTEDPSMRWDYWIKHYADDKQQSLDPKIVKGKGVWYPRAGTLGGSTAHNALVAVTPFESDWDDIAGTMFDESWSSKNMRKYFRLLERNQYANPSDPKSKDAHGFDGWLGIERTPNVFNSDKLMDSWFNAAARVTTRTPGGGNGQTVLQNGDLNRYDSRNPEERDTTAGVYQIPVLTYGGKRNAARERILDIANRKKADGSKMYKLDIRMNCFVTKITFDKNKVATGVEFLDGKSLYAADPRYKASAKGTPGSVKGNKEVIISAGAFNTPQILKLSGIGPAAELKKFNIPVIKDLPGVGANLQDRYEVAVVYEGKNNFTIFSNCTFSGDTNTDPCLADWVSGAPKSANQPKTAHRGIYATDGVPAGIVRRSSKAHTDEIDTFIFGAPIDFRGFYPGYAEAALTHANHFTWGILKAHTGNTAGTVTLASADPRIPPNINFNYFQTTFNNALTIDLNAVVEGIRAVRNVAAALNGPSRRDWKEIWPGPSVDTTEKLEAYVKNTAWGHHASCTCKMGRDDDPMAVLDSSFRVRGVKGLRVVDASVFPKIPGMFICVPIYIMSEKAADVILNGK